MSSGVVGPNVQNLHHQSKSVTTRRRPVVVNVPTPSTPVTSDPFTDGGSFVPCVREKEKSGSPGGVSRMTGHTFEHSLRLKVRGGVWKV